MAVTTFPLGCRSVMAAAVCVLLGLFAANQPARADNPLSPSELVAASEVQGGFVVHLGCGEGEGTAALLVDDRFVVHGLDRDPKKVAKARERIQSMGRYGAVSVDTLMDDHLPYQDALVNLLIAQQTYDLPEAELMRVLAPGGVLFSMRQDKWQKTVKPWPDTIDDWTHYLHDASGNAVAADQQVGPPKSIRWAAGPLWSRSHEFNPSINALVSGGGRMFYILDEGMLGLPDLRFPARWALYARDAFNGKLLWKKPIPKWGYREWNTRGMWSAPLTLNRRVVTDGRRVFMTFGYKSDVTVLDAATGRKIRTVPASMGTDEMILYEGVLLLCTREQLSVASPPKTPPKRRMNPGEYTIASPGPAKIVAVDVETGEVRWQTDAQPVTVLTLCAHQNRVCFHGGDSITCLSLDSGDPLWTAKNPGTKGSRHSHGTLVMQQEVVLFTGRGGLVALDAGSGKPLWTGPRVGGPGITHPPDLFVAGGLVWTGDVAGTHSRERTSVRREGRNLLTGEVEKTIDIGNLISPLHHFRCYRSKATDDYLMLGKRGVEFIDLEGSDHMRNDWLRAMCHYGFMPCNGLLYIPPHHCFCYPGVKMSGFLALTDTETVLPPAQDAQAPGPPRLQKGPAYDQTRVGRAVAPPASEDWSTYRGDAKRSGATQQQVPTQLTRRWRTEIGGKVTPPVFANGKTFVAQVDAHCLHCIDPSDGTTKWRFVAGGRIDSPPTIYADLALFGCRDGWVYAVRVEDGRLAWRFQAAPKDQRILAFDQVESPWPVPGSILVLDDVAYFAAGRSSFLDGGVLLYGLKPTTGERLYDAKVAGPWPDVESEKGRPFDMEGTLSDILVTDGDHIYLYQMTFDKQLRDVTPQRASTLGNRQSGMRLVSTGGFLDDSWYDRTYWMYSKQWPGFYYANDAPKAGQILVFDESTTYGLHVFTKRARLSPMYTPGTGYELFADDNDNEPVLQPKSIDREKGPGFSRSAPPKWSKTLPVRARAMVLANDKLFLAGPPDVVPEDDPYAAFEGRRGAELWVVSAADGDRLANYPIQSLPAFDGLIAVDGQLLLTTADGSLECYAGPDSK